MKKTLALIVATGLLGLTLLAAPLSPAYAATCAPGDTSTKCQICAGIDPNNNCSGDPKPINDLLTIVVNVLTTIVGVAAVIMIIFSGFQFITAGGDTGKVTGAKNTIVYALIGIAVVALAQFIVHFVINTVKQ